MLGHTRWASVGVISEANAHPVDQEESADAGDAPYAVAALNGDVDNHADLKVAERPAHPRRDHRPTRRSSRRSSPAGWPWTAHRGRGVPLARSPASTAPWRSPRPWPAQPDRLCSRCAAAARRSTSGSPTTPSSSPASPTASSRSAARTCASTARRCSETGGPTGRSCPRRRAGGNRRRASRRLTYDGRAVCRSTPPSCRAPQITTRDIDRGEAPALPAQGDLGGAEHRSARRCAGKIVERRRPPGRAPRPREHARRSVRDALGGGHDPPGPRDRPGHRRGGGQSRVAAAIAQPRWPRRRSR